MTLSVSYNYGSNILAVLNVSKQTFHILHVRISRSKKLFNMKSSTYISLLRRRYWQIFKSALVYLWLSYTKMFLLKVVVS